MAGDHVERQFEILVFPKTRVQVFQGGCQNLPCHWLDAPTGFRERDKTHGGNRGAVLTHPSSQHLAPTNGTSAQIERRLEERLEIVPGQGSIDIGYRAFQPGCRPRQQQTKDQPQHGSDQHSWPISLSVPSLQSTAFNADRRMKRVSVGDVAKADQIRELTVAFRGELSNLRAVVQLQQYFAMLPQFGGHDVENVGIDSENGDQ